MPFVIQSGKSVLFVHIPRTGGTSIEAWMRKLAPLKLHNFQTGPSMKVTPQHLTRADVDCLLGDWPWDLAFAVVRNPYKRLESEYRYACRRQPQDDGSWPMFSDWVEEQLSRAETDPCYNDNHFRPQSDFLGGDTKAWRFENQLHKAFASVAECLGIDRPEQLPHLNASPSVKVTWTPSAKAAADRAYHKDFEVLGYQRQLPAPAVRSSPEVSG